MTLQGKAELSYKARCGRNTADCICTDPNMFKKNFLRKATGGRTTSEDTALNNINTAKKFPVFPSEYKQQNLMQSTNRQTHKIH